MKHVRNALIAVLVLLIMMPCVASAATYYKAFTNKKTYVYKRPSKSSRKVQVPMNTKVYVFGASGKFYKVKNASRTVTGYILKTDISKNKTVPGGSGDETEDGQEPQEGSETDPSWKSKVVKLKWFSTGKNVMKRGTYAYLYDINTGIRMRIKRMGGTNHADVEPATAADTAKLKQIAGGTFSWTCHAVILQANGKYVACSINTMPHGSQTIQNNNYDGQFCLHMVGSLTHGTKRVNPNHQACIEKAYKWAHG